MKKFILALFLLFMSISNYAQKTGSVQFFENLKQHCGKAYEGTVTEGRGDNDFTKNRLVMHVRACGEDEIRIPFFVGDDKSRTWILTLKDNRIQLKHDHRHNDGSNDSITMYGGMSTNYGADTIQMFPADQYTYDLIPYAANNVWWITLNNNTFTYNLRRIGSNRLFTVSFDLSNQIETPTAPWGWKD